MGPRFGDPPRIHYRNVDALSSRSFDIVMIIDIYKCVSDGTFEVCAKDTIIFLHASNLKYSNLRSMGFRFGDPLGIHCTNVDIFDGRSLEAIIVAVCRNARALISHSPNEIVVINSCRNVGVLNDHSFDMMVTIDVRAVLDRCFPTFSNVV